MNPDDRRLIISIGRAARQCAMYRELLEIARRYGDEREISRLTAALAVGESTLARLINEALDDNEPGQGSPA